MNCIWKNIIIVCAMFFGVCAFTTSCNNSNIDEQIVTDQNVTISFVVGVDDIAITRVGEGSEINKLLIAIYNEEGKFIAVDDTATTVANNKINGKLSFNLLYGHTYQAVFFAYNDETYSFSDSYKTIAFNFPDEPEKLDAFYKSTTFTATSETTIYETLTRQLMLLVFGIKNEYYVDNLSASVAINNVATSFNSLTGGASDDKDDKSDITFTFIPNGETKVPNNDNYTLLGMTYILPGEYTPTLSISVNGVLLKTFTLSATENKANTIYNYLCNIDLSGSN